MRIHAFCDRVSFMLPVRPGFSAFSANKRAFRQRVGGKLVMVERRKDHEKLLAFYRDNGFQSWTSRIDECEHIDYDQMFAVL